MVGEAATAEERVDLLLAMAEASHGRRRPDRAARALVDGAASSRPRPPAARRPEPRELASRARRTDACSPRTTSSRPCCARSTAASSARRPAATCCATPAVLPTGRNLHGFDPFRIPSAFAVADGARQAERLLARHAAEGNALPETVALVLWGTDNLKSEGGPIAQALALIGAAPALRRLRPAHAAPS